MAELNSTGTTTRAWAAGDEVLVINEGGGSPDTIARVNGGIPAALIDGAPTLGQIIALRSRAAFT